MGSNALSETFEPLNVPLVVTIVSILFALIYSFLSVYPIASTNERIDDLGGLSIIHAWNFFSGQYDFIQAQFRKNGNKMFRFNILKVRPFINHPFLDAKKVS